MKVPFTNKVVTLWYRPPELLLGETDYDEKVDIWSAGCILAELLLGKALLPGTSDMEQLSLIFKMMGTPTKQTWEGYSKLMEKKAVEIAPFEKSEGELQSKYHDDKRIPRDALNLVGRMLKLDPGKRCSAKMALESQFFRTQPFAPDLPEDLGQIPVGGDSHEFQTKRIRKQAKAVAQKASAAAKSKGENEKLAYETAYSDFLQKANDAKAKGIDLPFEDDTEEKTRKPKNKEDEKYKSKSRDRGREKSKDRHREKENEHRRHRRERDRERGRYNESKHSPKRKQGLDDVITEANNQSNGLVETNKMEYSKSKNSHKEEKRDNNEERRSISVEALGSENDTGEKEQKKDRDDPRSSPRTEAQQNVRSAETSHDGSGRRSSEPKEIVKTNGERERAEKERKEQKGRRDERTRDKRESNSRSRRDKRRRDGSYDYYREGKERQGYSPSNPSRSRDESKDISRNREHFEEGTNHGDRNRRSWNDSDRHDREKRRRRSSSHDRSWERSLGREGGHTYSKRDRDDDSRFRERQSHQYRHDRRGDYERDDRRDRNGPPSNERYKRHEKPYGQTERSREEHGRQRDYRRHNEKRYGDYR